MSNQEVPQYIKDWRPNAQLLPTQGGLSGASFYAIENYYEPGVLSSEFSLDAVLKVPISVTIPTQDVNLQDSLQSNLGTRYDKVFVPTTIIDLDPANSNQGIISPKFISTIAEEMRSKEPPTPSNIDEMFGGILYLLQELNSTKTLFSPKSFAVEMQDSLLFCARTLRTQLAGDSQYGYLSDKIMNNIQNIPSLVPTNTTLSANDLWLGNIARINKQGDLRLFDPMATLPLSNIKEFSEEQSNKGIESPKARNILLDYGRVSVNIRRFVVEWQNKKWIKSAAFLENTILPQFRKSAIEEIGEPALILGELLNNVYFAICNCEFCTNSGFLTLAYQQIDQILETHT